MLTLSRSVIGLSMRADDSCRRCATKCAVVLMPTDTRRSATWMTRYRVRTIRVRWVVSASFTAFLSLACRCCRASACRFTSRLSYVSRLGYTATLDRLALAISFPFFFFLFFTFSYVFLYGFKIGCCFTWVPCWQGSGMPDIILIPFFISFLISFFFRFFLFLNVIYQRG